MGVRPVRCRALGLALWVLAAPAAGAQGITREEALAASYPGASIRSEQVFLTKPQIAEIARRAGTDGPPALIARYIATRNGATVGRAYIDTHIVRTKPESLLISLDAEGRVKRIDVTAFLEPAEYEASDAWLRQYENRILGNDLHIDRAIRPVAGATLTARATNNAVRRVLAIDQVLQAEAAR